MVSVNSNLAEQDLECITDIQLVQQSATSEMSTAGTKQWQVLLDICSRRSNTQHFKQSRHLKPQLHSLILALTNVQSEFQGIKKNTFKMLGSNSTSLPCLHFDCCLHIQGCIQFENNPKHCTVVSFNTGVNQPQHIAEDETYPLEELENLTVKVAQVSLLILPSALYHAYKLVDLVLV